MTDGGLIAQISAMSAGAKGIWLFGLILVSGQVLKWAAEYRAWRKLSFEEKQANREGFTAQVEFLSRQLREANARLETVLAELAAERSAHDEYRRLCHAETEALRIRIARLEDDLAAVDRKKRAEGTALAREVIDPKDAPHAAASIDRTAAHLGDDGPK